MNNEKDEKLGWFVLLLAKWMAMYQYGLLYLVSLNISILINHINFN